MYIELFESLGLSPNEAKIYESLIYQGESSVGEVAVRAKIHRRNIYDALQRLIEKGLVFPIFQKGENRYQAVAPDKLMEIVREKERALSGALPTLRDIYEADAPQQAAYVYKGLEGYKNYMRDLVRVAEDTLFLGAKGLWFTPGIDRGFLNAFQQMARKKKISYRTIYDPRVPQVLPQALTDVGGEYQVFPEGVETPGVCDIFGDYVVTFTSVSVGNFGEDGMVYVIIDRDLANTYRAWFEFMWTALK